ncbi:phenylacetate--CoA ligase family protein [Candidatus Woesearchaeota archaeon]|nr:phenylacetate--CoA ligase family protein [Candidatus Woesearchaeota archaeon]
MNKFIIKHITFPLWEFGAGRKRLQVLKELEKSQHWPKEKLVELQNNRLKALIGHAYNNVPYYHELFKKKKLKPSDIRTVADLYKIPILTKDIIADNFDKLKAKNIQKYQPKYYSTGGTSGRHLHFYNSQATFDAHMAAAYRGWRWSGWDFGEKYAYVWGASMDLKNESTIKKKIKTFFTENRLLIQALMFTDESLKYDCERLFKFNPDYIITYPSSLVVIVKYMKSKGIIIKVKGVITSAEKLFPWQRKLFEDFFSCRVYDDYGGRESSIRSTQCEQCGGYHISVENGVLETIRNGKNVIGVPGKVLLTEFHNYAMPLIRYENTDVVTLTDKQCKCGRALPMLKNVQGRVSDIFVTADGKYIPAEYFMVAFLEFTGKYYQVIQEKKNEIVIKIVKGRHFKKSNLDEIEKTMRKWLGDAIRIKIEFVEDIPLTSQGKRRYFISKVPLEF